MIIKNNFRKEKQLRVNIKWFEDLNIKNDL